PLTTAAEAERFDAPRDADLLIQTITHANASGSSGEYRFYAPDGRLLEARALPDYAFDPRSRPWYSSAMLSGETILTEPYLFFTTRVAGVTLARRTDNGGAVVGLD